MIRAGRNGRGLVRPVRRGFYFIYVSLVKILYVYKTGQYIVSHAGPGTTSIYSNVHYSSIEEGENRPLWYILYTIIFKITLFLSDNSEFMPWSGPRLAAASPSTKATCLGYGHYRVLVVAGVILGQTGGRTDGRDTEGGNRNGNGNGNGTAGVVG